jgi:hypothetical protein
MSKRILRGLLGDRPIHKANTFLYDLVAGDDALVDLGLGVGLVDGALQVFGLGRLGGEVLLVMAVMVARQPGATQEDRGGEDQPGVKR